MLVQLRLDKLAKQDYVEITPGKWSYHGIKIQKVFHTVQKLKILKEGLLTNIKISDLYKFYNIYPTDYYRKRICDTFSLVADIIWLAERCVAVNRRSKRPWVEKDVTQLVKKT